MRHALRAAPIYLLTLVMAAACGSDRRPRRSQTASEGGGGGTGGVGEGEGEGGGVEGEGEGEGGDVDAGTPGGSDAGDFEPHLDELPPGSACGGALVRACGGPTGGLCRPGWQWCDDGQWLPCQDYLGPLAEACDGLDNDCDGKADGVASGCAPHDTGDPDASAGPLEALGRMNELRTAVGVPLVKLHPHLNAGAQAHADYYVQNLPDSQRNAHGEDAGRPGFTGADPGARARAAGWQGTPMLTEDMAFGAGPAGSIQAWYDTVYHRIPIIHPAATEMGFGHGPGVEVLDVALGGGEDTEILVPFDGETGVPTSFHSDWEGPDPVDGDDLVGYPVSVTRNVGIAQGGVAEIVPDGGEPYEIWIADNNGPARGFLPSSLFLMTQDPMQPGTWHTVRIRYSVGPSQREVTWRFKTAGGR